MRRDISEEQLEVEVAENIKWRQNLTEGRREVKRSRNRE